MAKEKKVLNDGTVPESVFNQVVEHTVGGFILFYFNQETGIPEQVMTFDSPAHYLALQKHVGDWAQIMQEIKVETSVNSALQDED